MIFFRTVLPVIALTLFLTAPAFAQDSKPASIGKFGAWEAFSFTENGKRVCYMASRPMKDEGNYSQRGDIYALITHRPGEKSRDVFSYVTGYPYKGNTPAKLVIDSREFDLFTEGETAWTYDAETDGTVAKAIQSGSRMIVKGVSSRGTETKDTYSLSGSSKAYEAISKACS